MGYEVLQGSEGSGVGGFGGIEGDGESRVCESLNSYILLLDSLRYLDFATYDSHTNSDQYIGQDHSHRPNAIAPGSRQAGVVASTFCCWRASSKGAAEEGRVHAVLVAGVGCQQQQQDGRVTANAHFQKLASCDASAQKRILYPLLRTTQAFGNKTKKSFSWFRAPELKLSH